MKPTILEAGGAGRVLRSMAQEAANRHRLLLKAADRVEQEGKPITMPDLERIVEETGRMAMPRPARPARRP